MTAEEKKAREKANELKYHQNQANLRRLEIDRLLAKIQTRNQ